MSSAVVLLAIAAAQLGFQLTVTLVVYPALADTVDALWVDWERVHARHSRRIVVPVVLLYGALVLAVPLALRSTSSGDPARPWLVATGACLVLLVLTTMLLAAPTHGRLGREPSERRGLLLVRLRSVDRIRLGWSLALVGCAAGAVLVR